MLVSTKRSFTWNKCNITSVHFAVHIPNRHSLSDSPSYHIWVNKYNFVYMYIFIIMPVWFNSSITVFNLYQGCKVYQTEQSSNFGSLVGQIQCPHFVLTCYVWLYSNLTLTWMSSFGCAFENDQSTVLVFLLERHIPESLVFWNGGILFAYSKSLLNYFSI